ncbi:MAG TPA: adenine phosphoribosyltransferase [Succinivibrionaceae bacterium]|nr:adenine phosphoribosyltransferase [Succinivibrio sp.]HAR80436.1 adenine phosphoribosyltransferase [Succinivibrionaceae bacterium]
MFDLNKIPDIENKIEYLKSTVTSIQDYPKPGILFRDITTLCGDKKAFNLTIEILKDVFKDAGIDKVVSAEARGFVFGAPIAAAIGAGFILVRKPGKLPRKTAEVSYDLEYGSNILQICDDAIKPGDNILIVDDLLATGGTVGALVQLTRKLGGNVKAAAFIIDLFDLGGADILKNKYQVESVSLLKFPGH